MAGQSRCGRAGSALTDRARGQWSSGLAWYHVNLCFWGKRWLVKMDMCLQLLLSTLFHVCCENTWALLKGLSLCQHLNPAFPGAYSVRAAVSSWLAACGDGLLLPALPWVSLCIAGIHSLLGPFGLFVLEPCAVSTSMFVKGVFILDWCEKGWASHYQFLGDLV